jgi:dynein heavy chain
VQSKFADLDCEDMTTTTVRYAKSVYQLEKGLPPNGVVPMLKERVEGMKDKVCFCKVESGFHAMYCP